MMNLEAIKTIPWSRFFEIVTEPMVTYQIIPDRTARNWSVNDLARSLHEIYTAPLSRFSAETKLLFSLKLPIINCNVNIFMPTKIKYRPQEHISFDVTLEPNMVRFWLTVPRRWSEYSKQRLETIWPKATIKPAHIPAINPEKASCAILTLKNHDFYSLATSRNDNRPLNSLLEAVKDLKEKDIARVQILAIPKDRQVWEQEALEAYKQYRKAQELKKQEYSLGAIVKMAFEMLNGLFTEAASVTAEFFSVEPTEIKKDNATIILRYQQKLSEATIKKVSEPTFCTNVRIAVHSEDQNRASLVIKTLAAAYNDLAEDNELKRLDVSTKKVKNFVQNMNQFKAPIVKINYCTLSASELGKFMQLPGAELQDQYPAIEQISLRETNVPAIITEGGILLGAVKCHGQEIPVYLPTVNFDELCLPHIVIGGMGTGKTCGFGANLIVEAVRNGFGAVAIDPAKGEIGDQVEALLPKDKVVRIKLGKAPIALDWREALHSDRVRNRLANELIAFVEAAAEEAGAQTIRFMRAAAKAVPKGRLSEVVALMTDAKYRKQLIPTMRPQEALVWEEFDKLSEARQLQIAMPVLNRLDVIMGDDYLSECMDHEEGLDFAKLLKEPKAIIIDIPKSELGTEGVNVLASLIATKLDMAMVLRQSKFPVFIVQDEPHQYLRSARTWRSAAVESRKWRFSYIWMFHAWEQIPRDVAAIIQAAGPHYHIYSSSKKTYQALAEEIKPFDLEEAMATPRHWALNVIKADNRTITPFLAKMLPPPKMRK